ncbi:MAG: DNA mismatch repair endonuclease MutL [Lachnospiraceae bacterium]|nr:DNA mismatch repair endonuclease MutL [Lachnospiraceae bacterium]
MSKIHVLDSDTINQIAAGEVVERPASVVKELVENAVDAGASSVTVEIREGGIGLVRVTDNGAGIPREEVRTAFLRHATSKITTALDLLTVNSLGFRGEALSSIASVAMVELVTKTREEFTGSRYVIEGGQEKELAEVGAPEGTTFLVRSLFYNTPARRKFLKTAMTEAGYISDLMERFAIAHPEVAFKFINNNKTVLQTSGNGNLRDCIYHIFGREITAALLDVPCPAGDIRAAGFVGKPVISRGNRNYENYFINGRYIRSNIITRAIEEAYKPYTMQHKYPFTVLLLEIPPKRIDVNVHPTKLEIRFDDGEELYRLVFGAVRDALAGKNMIPDAVLSESRKEKRVYAASPEPFEHNRLTMSRDALRQQASQVREKAIEATLKAELFAGDGPEPEKRAGSETAQAGDRTAETAQEPAGAGIPESGQEPKSGIKQADAGNPESEQRTEQDGAGMRKPVPETETGKSASLVREECAYSAEIPNGKAPEPERPQQLSLFEAAERTKEAFLKKESADRYRIIGQLFATYWLVEFEEQLFIIDQHAAHEKILYERTVRRMKEKAGQGGLSQLLAPPEILSLSIREAEVLRRYQEHFEALGFEIEEFGGREYSVRAVPVELYGADGRALLTELLDTLLDEPPGGAPDMILDRIAAMSCKAAVKGNMTLSEPEAKAMLDELLLLENPFHCPHGRPIIISMTKHEIERKFKRIVN